MRKRLLIDTQILIWFYQEHPSLTQDIKDIIGNEQNDVFVSQISFYEIAIKQKIGKLPDFNKPLAEVIQQVESNEFQVWAVANQHLIHYDQIPYYKDHSDPFDRLILATALAEQVAVISADEKFERDDGLIELIRA